MACRSDDYDIVPRAAIEAAEMKKQLDQVTRLLCDVMKLVEKQVEVNALCYKIPGLKNWWEKHKEDDKRREERDIKSAMSKLSHDELDALTKSILSKK